MLTEHQLDIMSQMVDMYPAVLAHTGRDGSAVLVPARPCPACEDDPDCFFCEGKGALPLTLTPVLVPATPETML